MSVTRYDIDWDRLRKVRFERTKKVMVENDIDVLILTMFDCIRYVTDLRPLFTPSVYIDGYAAIIPKDGEPVAIGPFVEGGNLGYADAETMPPVYVPSPVVASQWAKIFRKTLEKQGITRGHVGVDYFPLAVYEATVKEMPKLEFKPFLDEFLTVKAVKDNEEVKLLREAASIVDLGAAAGYGAIKEGRREHEILSEIVRVMVNEGIEAFPWYPTFRSGERSLHTVFPSDRRVKKGDCVVFDLGCVGRGGYYGDESRTGFVGTPHEDLKRAYKVLYTAYMEAVKKIKPGMMASEIHALIREKLEEMGYSYMTVPSGHGLGLGLDYPWITDMAGEKDMKLQPNMVLSIEPVTYSKMGSVKLEDAVLVTETGSEILTKASYLEEYL